MPRMPWTRRAARIIRDAGRARLALTLLVLLAALFVARSSWDMPFIGNAERALYDLRVTLFAPKVAQDDRMVMVVYNDQTLIDTRKRSPLDRATLAQALRNLDSMGAKSIGIDILVDQPQDEDPQLLAALRAMRTPTWLAYASLANNAGNITYDQQAFLDTFMAALKGTQTRPASIRLEVDGDGVARSWAQQDPSLPPLLTKAMLGTNSAQVAAFERFDGSIRYRLPQTDDRPGIASLPIDLFTDRAMAGALTEQIRGRHVLIGGDIVDVDQFETPMTALTGRTLIGLEVHANMLAQMLDGVAWPRLPSVSLWAIALMVVLAAVMTSLMDLRWWQTGGFALVQLTLFGGLPFWLQGQTWDTQDLPALGWAIGWVISYAATGSAARAVGSQQRRFAQSALGKYLPRDIASAIMADPDQLALHGEKREIFVVFTDLEGFTKLSHAIAPEMVAQLLNRYLDMLSDVVLDHGGTIDKFVGDAVVAFWGAPIARSDDGANAARAAFAMWQAGEVFRATVPDGVPPIGQTRVGLHFGEAIVGNFGGEGRIQYTALGDSMNTASRLEAANKALHSNVLASREAVERSGQTWWRPMGRIILRGRATPVDIFDAAPDFPSRDADHLRAILNALDSGSEQAVTDLAALVARYPGDEALENMYYRVRNSTKGNAYDLG